ncbi:MAG: hypothetical protein CL928_15145 [Deltaproteobacteria bacterium]|nr:hypothetical protein [Deltaproteobacteria bacterium]
MGLRRDPVSGQFTYHSTVPSSLTAEQIASMPFGELQGHIYRGVEDDRANWINAELAKQAEMLNIAEESAAMSRDALENFGDRQRRQLQGSYEQQLSRIDPRLSGTTISSAQRAGLQQAFNQQSTDLEQQILEATVGIMRPEFRNRQQIIGGRTDTGPDMNAMNRLMLQAGMAGRGASGPDTPETWQSLLGGAAMNWATTPGGPEAGSPLNRTINSILGLDGGWGDGGGGGGVLGGLRDLFSFGGGGGTTSYDYGMGAGTGPLRPGAGGGPGAGGLFNFGNFQLPDSLTSLGSLGSLGGGGGLGGLATAAAPYAALAAAAYGGYELWDHNKDDIRRETGRIGEQIQDEVKRTGKKIGREAKRIWDKIF